MRKTLVCALLLAVTGSSATSQDAKPVVDSGVHEALLERVISRAFEKGARKHSLVAGLIVDGKTTIRGYGRLSKDDARRPTADTVYEIGSLTKLFTALLLAIDIERGQLELEAKAATLFGKAWDLPSWRGQELTLLDLATHTSALPRMPRNIKPKNQLDPYSDYSEEQLRSALAKLMLIRPIGQRYLYSNLGFGLLGHGLAKRVGSTFESRVQSDICEPLGMTSTKSVLDASMKERFAPAHFANGLRSRPWTFDVLAPAGSLRSSMRDMLRFAAVQVEPPKSPLGRAILATQLARRRAGKRMQVGLAWHLVEDERVGTVLAHAGMTGGYASQIMVIPRKGMGIVLLTNEAKSASTLAMTVLRECELLSKSENRRR